MVRARDGDGKWPRALAGGVSYGVYLAQHMGSPPDRVKWLLGAVFIPPFFIWLAWYASTYARIRRDAVRDAAASALACPAESVLIGPSRQEGDDGPSEFSVTGCGRDVTILCEDNGSRHGMVRQYFVFDLACRAQE